MNAGRAFATLCDNLCWCRARALRRRLGDASLEQNPRLLRCELQRFQFDTLIFIEHGELSSPGRNRVLLGHQPPSKKYAVHFVVISFEPLCSFSLASMWACVGAISGCVSGVTVSSLSWAIWSFDFNRGLVLAGDCSL